MDACTSTYTCDDARDDTTDDGAAAPPEEQVRRRRRTPVSASVFAPARRSSRRTSADDIAGTALPGYAIMNLRATYAITADWRLTGRIENLFDRDYELVHGYNTPGLSGFLEVVWQPAAR